MALQGMLLAGVDICSKEYDKVIEWYNKYRELVIPIFAKKNKRIEELTILIDFKIKIINNYKLMEYELKRKSKKLEEKLEDCELGIQATTRLNDDLEKENDKLKFRINNLT